MSLLDVKGLKGWYGKSQALFDVSFTVDEGEVVCLMGRNGMGKTSTIRAILGMLEKREGVIALSGQSLLGVPSHRAAQMGLGLTPEGRRAFPNLSVLENLTVAARPGSWTLPEVYQLFPRLEERRDQSAATLSGGEQQMLVIGRALMTNPKLLILDEATEGLAPVIRQEIWGAIRALKGEGMSILLVDKTLKELLAIADKCVILERGMTVWTGRPADVKGEIADRYLGV